MSGNVTLASAMAALYKLEKNCRVSSFWDNGFLVEIGDDMNGFEHSQMFESHELDTKAAQWVLGFTTVRVDKE